MPPKKTRGGPGLTDDYYGKIGQLNKSWERVYVWLILCTVAECIMGAALFTNSLLLSIVMDDHCAEDVVNILTSEHQKKQFSDFLIVDFKVQVL